jgi:hypothetical protein
MDLYLAAAYQNEQAESNPEGRETWRAYEEALLALNRHKGEHGC